MEDPYHALLTESYVYGSFLKVQHTYWKTLVSSVINVTVSLHKPDSLNGVMALSFRFHTTFLIGILFFWKFCLEILICLSQYLMEKADKTLVTNVT